MTSLPGLRLPDYVDAIDVSRVQVVEDADAVRAAGFLAAWAKASEGLGYCDPEVQEHLRRLSGAGIITSVYAFARVQQGDPAAQARPPRVERTEMATAQRYVHAVDELRHEAARRMGVALWESPRSPWPAPGQPAHGRSG